MKAIVAKNNLGFIGIGNKMLWHCKEDLQHFKKLTMGCDLLVGYNTAQELPPLKGRNVITDQRGVNYIKSDDANDFWLIGGKKTYEKYASVITELHISHINNDSIGDVTFPDLTNLNPICKIFNYNF